MESEKRSILVVDSSASSIFYMSMLLRELRYAVRSAPTGEDALIAIAGSAPAVVITDTVLSKMSGVELLKHIKNNVSLRFIPVIICTANANSANKETCTQAGCSAYLMKPVEPEALYRAIQSATETTPRQNIRIDLSLKVQLGDESSPDWLKREEEVTTLSEGGLYIKSNVPEAVNTVMPLTFFIGSRAIKARAEVLYSSLKIGGQHKVPGMGLKFVSIADQDKEFIRNFIKDLITKDPGSDARQ
jgi:CheY-like chemotaxis protein